MKIVNIAIGCFFGLLLLFMFIRSRKSSSSTDNPTSPPPVVCNNHGGLDQNGNCVCEDPWYGEKCEFSQSIEGINISSIYKTVLAEIARLNKNTTDVRLFGKARDYYVKRAVDAPGQKTLIGSSVENDTLACADKSSDKGASFFTFHPQTKVCSYYSQPSTMSLMSLVDGNLIVGCKNL